jgi:hypothetical protein
MKIWWKAHFVQRFTEKKKNPVSLVVRNNGRRVSTNLVNNSISRSTVCSNMYTISPAYGVFILQRIQFAKPWFFFYVGRSLTYTMVSGVSPVSDTVIILKLFKHKFDLVFQ